MYFVTLLTLSNYFLRATFYLLFFLVPLVFSAQTSELFEYNKMMLTYAATIIIASAWLIKMISSGKIIYKSTLLEIPLLLYLFSHLLSTIFSLDPHVSFWGYYSRFHEGFLASLSYVLLYFAAVSNLDKDDVKKILYVSFSSGLIVSLWGILEHFGNSVSCLIVTGRFDVNCWIQDVQSRVFATLGQPNWMAAYLDILILIALSFKNRLSLLSVPFFIALLCTKSRSGLGGLAAEAVILGGYLIFKEKKKLLTNSFLILSSFLILISYLLFNLPSSTPGNTPLPSPNPEINISESGDIRKVVWEGAVKIWQRYPVFGSGVETFAYAYYKDRPATHNLLSEWDFLYNKAHNEYLNLLATTGTVGIITYFLVILTFTFSQGVFLFKQGDSLKSGLLAAFVSILVTNFFGFSVVIIGLYFFLIPAFCEILSN